MPKTTFIYALCDPDTLEVRYVGKADNLKKRYKGHLEEKKLTHKRNWIVNLLRQGKKPIIQMIEEVCFDVWEEMERKWIAHYRKNGARLVNGNGGGIGMHKPTEEIREKMRLAKLGCIPWSKGKKMSEEMCFKNKERLREYYKTHQGSMTGKKMSIETKEKMRVAKIGYVPWNKGGKASSEAIKNQIDSHCRYVYIFKNPNNQTIECESVRDLCRRYPELTFSAMYRVTYGECKSHKGWVFVNKTKTDIDERKVA